MRLRCLLVFLLICICSTAHARGLLPHKLEHCGVNFAVTKDDHKSEEIENFLKEEGATLIKDKLVNVGIDAYSTIKSAGYLYVYVEYFEGLESQNMPPGPYSITLYYYPPESNRWSWFERNQMKLSEYSLDSFKRVLSEMVDEFIDDFNAKELINVSGEYTNQHTIRTTKWDQSDPTKDVPVEVIIEVEDKLILKEDGSHIELDISINADLGHTCGLLGKAELLDDVIIYNEHFEGTDDYCQLKIRRTEEGLQLHDSGGVCRRYYCGARGAFDGVIFVRDI